MSIKKPKIELGNFTCINNLLIDKIMPTLPANAWKVLTFIIRQTVGLHKDREALSYEQIKKGTGIRSDTTVCKMLLILTQKSLVCVSSPGDWRSNHYCLNSNLSITLDDGDAQKFEIERPHNVPKKESSTPKSEVERRRDVPKKESSTPKSEVEQRRDVPKKESSTPKSEVEQRRDVPKKESSTPKSEVERRRDVPKKESSTPKSEVEQRRDVVKNEPSSSKYQVEQRRSFNFFELLDALQAFNSQLPNPLKAPRQLAAELDERGETVESMQQTFMWCEQNSPTALKTFLLWIQSGELPDV